MATLNNPVNGNNLVERFNDFVAATANRNIVWGTDNKPFSQMPNSTFGGTTSGMGNLTGNLGLTGLITANDIITKFSAATSNYTRIRRLRARLNVTGGGGNTGSQSTAGIIFDETQVSNLSTTYAGSVGTPDDGGVQQEKLISRASLQGGGVLENGFIVNYEGFFRECRAEYQNLRDTSVTVTVNVCHASCHRSCHSSRTRR
jgi:hypothetical protein